MAMGPGYLPWILFSLRIDVENLFPLRTDVENLFPLRIDVENLFSLRIDAENPFSLSDINNNTQRLYHDGITHHIHIHAIWY